MCRFILDNTMAGLVGYINLGIIITTLTSITIFALVILLPAFRALANASMVAFVASREKFAASLVSESSGVLSDKIQKLGHWSCLYFLRLICLPCLFKDFPDSSSIILSAWLWSTFLFINSRHMVRQLTIGFRFESTFKHFSYLTSSSSSFSRPSSSGLSVHVIFIKSLVFHYLSITVNLSVITSWLSTALNSFVSSLAGLNFEHLHFMKKKK